MFPEPTKILCVGLNYRSHAEETGGEAPKEPVIFSKFNDALAAVALFARLKRFEDDAAFDAFPDRVRFFHRDFPLGFACSDASCPNGGSVRTPHASRIVSILYTCARKSQVRKRESREEKTKKPPGRAVMLLPDGKRKVL